MVPMKVHRMHAFMAKLSIVPSQPWFPMQYSISYFIQSYLFHIVYDIYARSASPFRLWCAESVPSHLNWSHRIYYLQRAPQHCRTELFYSKIRRTKERPPTPASASRHPIDGGKNTLALVRCFRDNNLGILLNVARREVERKRAANKMLRMHLSSALEWYAHRQRHSRQMLAKMHAKLCANTWNAGNYHREESEQEKTHTYIRQHRRIPSNGCTLTYKQMLAHTRNAQISRDPSKSTG